MLVVSRARDADHARHLYEIGVTDAVPETIEASLQLSEAALVGLGVATGPVIASIHEKREEFRHELQQAAGVHSDQSADAGVRRRRSRPDVRRRRADRRGRALRYRALLQSGRIRRRRLRRRLDQFRHQQAAVIDRPGMVARPFGRP